MSEDRDYASEMDALSDRLKPETGGMTTLDVAAGAIRLPIPPLAAPILPDCPALSASSHPRTEAPRAGRERMQEYLQKVVDSAPPITAEQREILALVLSGVHDPEGNAAAERQVERSRAEARHAEFIAALPAQRVPTPEADGDTADRSVVYFMERNGFVKIGYTVNLKSRLSQVGTGSQMIEGMTVGPVRLLAAIPGSAPLEKGLHKRFAHLRMGGEWFLLDDDLREYVESLPEWSRRVAGADEATGELALP